MLLLGELLDHVRRHEVARPDLPVGMGVGTPHELAFVLEHLHPTPALPELGHLLRPGIDDRADFRNRHLRQRQIVTRRKTNHPASPRLHMRLEQRVLAGILRDRLRQKRRIIVGKHVSRAIRRIVLTVGTHVAGTQITLRIVLGTARGGRRLDPALPGTPIPVRRDENPLARQSVETPMR